MLTWIPPFLFRQFAWRSSCQQQQGSHADPVRPYLVSADDVMDALRPFALAHRIDDLEKKVVNYIISHDLRKKPINREKLVRRLMKASGGGAPMLRSINALKAVMSAKVPGHPPCSSETVLYGQYMAGALAKVKKVPREYHHDIADELLHVILYLLRAQEPVRRLR
jgi:hypothetical protein